MQNAANSSCNTLALTVLPSWQALRLLHVIITMNILIVKIAIFITSLDLKSQKQYLFLLPNVKKVNSFYLIALETVHKKFGMAIAPVKKVQKKSLVLTQHFPSQN